MVKEKQQKKQQQIVDEILDEILEKRKSGIEMWYKKMC